MFAPPLQSLHQVKPKEDKAMRKVIYHVAATVDGFIARADGSFDFFPMEGEHVADYLESLQTYDAVLMGRGTYEVGLKRGVTNPYPMMKSYVFSRSMQQSPDPAVRVVSTGAADFVRALKQETGRDIYLCGGGNLAAQLLSDGLIDELKIKLVPIALGSGVPMLGAIAKPLDLRLTASKIYGNGVLLLTYSVR
jgi:dihydrofolate reductase